MESGLTFGDWRNFGRFLVVLLVLGLAVRRASCEEFAEITQVVSHATVSGEGGGESTAAADKPVGLRDSVTTQANSRLEMVLPDETVIRLGVDSVFTSGPTPGDLDLQQGTMLIQAPPRAQGRNIQIGNVTATVKNGTLMAEVTKGQPIKLISVSGAARVRLKNGRGGSLLLDAGHMLILPPGVQNMAGMEPVAINMARLMTTARLVTGFKNNGSHLNSSSWARELAQQQAAFDRFELALTNLVLIGDGSDVFLARQYTLTQLQQFAVQLQQTQIGNPVSKSIFLGDTGSQTFNEALFGQNAAQDPYSILLELVPVPVEIQKYAINQFPSLTSILAVLPHVNTSLALVALDGNIVLTGDPGPVNFDPTGVNDFNEVLIAAKNGSITVGAPLTSIQADQIGLYAKGPNGSIEVDIPITTGQYGEIDIEGQNSVTLNSSLSSALISVAAGVFNSVGDNSGGSLNIANAYFSANSLFLEADNSGISLNSAQIDFGRFGSLGFLSYFDISSYASAGGDINLTGDFEFDPNLVEVNLFTSSGDITATGRLTGVEEISADSGSVSATVIGARTIFTGNLTAQEFIPSGYTGAQYDGFNGDEYDAQSISGNIEFGGAAETAGASATSGAALQISDLSNEVFGAGGITSADFSGGDALPNGAGVAGNGGTLVINSSGLDIEEPIFASSGKTSSGDPIAGLGGSVTLDNNGGTLTVNNTIEVSSNDVAGHRISASGGNISIQGNNYTPGMTSIHIASSAQLLALLNAAAPGPGGTITFVSNGGNIVVESGSKIQADRGTINMQNLDPVGQITINGGTMSADVIKVGALGNQGILTISAGSNISAVNLLELYGGIGSKGEVLFTGNGTVYLAGSPIRIAANTVQINSSTTVQNSGATIVNAGNANYNKGGFGNFTNPVTTQPLGSRVKF
jgi:hypothetical protein